jgi:hypothetical protein
VYYPPSTPAGELRCWYSRAELHEAVLGLPLRFTVNPKTQAIDYIEADLELLAVEAFTAGGGRQEQICCHVLSCAVVCCRVLPPALPCTAAICCHV